MDKVCSRCGSEYVVNKTHVLCDDCNQVRLHGMTRYERMALKSSRPADVSERQRVISSKLKEVKSKISLDRENDGTYACDGCGSSLGHLDRSHILSVKHRPDLQLDPRNINLLCRNCHIKWESWDPVKMTSLICFTGNMEYMRRMDQQRFYRMEGKMQQWLDENAQAQSYRRIKYIFEEIFLSKPYACSAFTEGGKLCKKQCTLCSTLESSGEINIFPETS